MTHPCHYGQRVHRDDGENGVEEDACKFVDLFCGMGGASTGAASLGYKIHLAVDSCERALSVHEMNHPGALHVCMRLPPPPSVGTEALPLPASGERWHCHGSPPCTALSIVRTTACTTGQRNEGLALVRWYLDFALTTHATTWSMEQVPTPPVMRVLHEYRARYGPRRIAFAVVDFATLGVPQTRVRVLAGTPKLIQRIQCMHCARRSVLSVIKTPRGTHIRSEKLYEGRPRKYATKRRKCGKHENCRSVHGLCYTVVAYKPLRWATPTLDRPLIRLTVEETAALQTFSPHCFKHHTASVANVQLGNAIPPLVMRHMMSSLYDASQTPMSPSLRRMHTPV